MDDMALQMNYQEKYEQGVEHEKEETASLMELGKFSIEEIADVTELPNSAEVFRVRFLHYISVSTPHCYLLYKPDKVLITRSTSLFSSS